MSTQSPRLLTKAQVADRLEASISYVGQLLAAKILPRVRLSYKVTRIPEQAVEEFIRSKTITPSTAKSKLVLHKK
jgi:ABC-type phosphate transport system auxiliary subunit